MFEKFTEKAKRVLFLARYEASQMGSKMGSKMRSQMGSKKTIQMSR